MLAEFEGRAKFLHVYIAEAHPQDAWPLGQHVCVLNHKTIEDRIGVAERFISETGWKLPVVVDSMSNGFMDAFKAHPERFYVIVNGKLGMKGEPVESYYLISHLRDWVANYIANNNSS